MNMIHIYINMSQLVAKQLTNEPLMVEREYKVAESVKACGSLKETAIQTSMYAACVRSLMCSPKKHVPALSG